MSRRRSGFTLIEMLVATVLAALLITADLAVNSRLSKDRALMERLPTRDTIGLRDLLSRDLLQAESIDDTTANQFTLIGHGSIDHSTLRPDQRWAKVSYQLIKSGNSTDLWRSQEYLDEPGRPQRWTERVAFDVLGWSLSSSRFTVETRTGGVSVERPQ